MTMDRVRARAKLAEAVMEVPTTKRPSLFLTMLQEEMSRRCFLNHIDLNELTDPFNRHDLYKWQHDHRPRPGRSASFSHVPLDRSALLDPSLAHIKEPGGFRRNFVVNRAQEQGLEAPTVLRNVIDFLFLYGHFVSVFSALLASRNPLTQHRPEKI
jgi:hypothetical protein